MKDLHIDTKRGAITGGRLSEEIECSADSQVTWCDECGECCSAPITSLTYTIELTPEEVVAEARKRLGVAKSLKDRIE